jgi:AcrR family transcriptional regulator
MNMSSTEAQAPRTRGYKKKERTRRQLIKAAVDEIAATGEAFTILDVTKRAEVSNGTFYNYFVDREALVDAVITEVMASFANTSAELVGLDDPVQRFATISALLLEHGSSNPQLTTVLLRLNSVAHLDGWPEDPFRHMRDDLREGFEQGRLATGPTDAAIDLVTGTLFRAVLRLTSTGDEPGYREEIITRMLLSFGVEAATADELAASAVAAAPELDRAYRDADPLQG